MGVRNAMIDAGRTWLRSASCANLTHVFYCSPFQCQCHGACGGQYWCLDQFCGYETALSGVKLYSLVQQSKLLTFRNGPLCNAPIFKQHSLNKKKGFLCLIRQYAFFDVITRSQSVYLHLWPLTYFMLKLGRRLLPCLSHWLHFLWCRSSHRELLLQRLVAVGLNCAFGVGNYCMPLFVKLCHATGRLQ